jgi:hypothetical protein
MRRRKMKTPKYIQITGPHSNGNRLYVKVRVKWWGWPVFIWRGLKECDIGVRGWLYAAYKFPGLWIKAARAHDLTE